MEKIEVERALRAEEAVLATAQSEVAETQGRLAAAEAALAQRLEEIEAELAEETAKFERERAALETQLSEAEKRSEARIAAMSAEVATKEAELETLAEQAEQDRAELVAELAGLNGQIVEREAQIKRQNRILERREKELTQVLEQLRAPEVFTLLESIRDYRVHIQAQAFNALRTELINDPAKRELVRKEIENSDEPAFQIALLMLLNRVKSDSALVEEVFEIATENFAEPRVWKEFSASSPILGEDQRALDLFLTVATRPEFPSDGLSNFGLHFIRWASDYSGNHIPVLRTDRGIAVVERFWAEFLGSPTPWDQIYATTVTSALHPRIGMVLAVLNVEFVRSNGDRFTRTQTLLRFEEIARLVDNDPMYLPFRDAMFSGDSAAFLADPVNA
ncbi:MAG: hypothetical protein AAFO93_11660, partial [Pseudomonadota bacterium]